MLNALLWNIGIFPWFTMAATLLFFPPDWPRQLWRRLVKGVRGVAPAFATADAPTWSVPGWPLRAAVTSFVAVWIAGQILVPLRFFAYPGFVSWHEQGHQFSWQMMLRTKSGVVRFVVRDPATGQTWQVDPEEFIDARQVRKMATHPEMIRQFAHHLERVWIQRSWNEGRGGARAFGRLAEWPAIAAAHRSEPRPDESRVQLAAA